MYYTFICMYEFNIFYFLFYIGPIGSLLFLLLVFIYTLHCNMYMYYMQLHSIVRINN